MMPEFWHIDVLCDIRPVLFSTNWVYLSDIDTRLNICQNKGINYNGCVTLSSVYSGQW